MRKPGRPAKTPATKFNFNSIQRNRYTPTSNVEIGGKYVKYGVDDKYPQYLLELYNSSAIHASCVNAIIEGIQGKNIEFNQVIGEMANDEETYYEVFTKLVTDFYIHGGFAYEVLWSNDRSTFQMYHIDFSFVRAHEKNAKGIIPKYYISEKFGKNSVSTTDLNKVDCLPTFNPETKLEEPKQIFYYKSYRPGQTYYPLPLYIAASSVIDLDREVDNFHINNVKNGLAPSLAITTFTNANEEQREQNKAEIETAYGGTDNAGSLVYMDVADPTLAPIITPIQTNENDQYYSVLDERTTNKIISAHRISSPMLLGIKSNVGLGSNAEEIETSYKHFLSTVVEPLQQDILKGFNKGLNTIYPGIDTKVIQRNPLGADNKVEITKVGEDSIQETTEPNITQ
jgi:hypothetical protein